MMDDMMGGMMGAAVLWWLLGLALPVVVIWVIVRTVGTPASTGGQDPPETILERRYARGEINRDEYERRLGELQR